MADAVRALGSPLGWRLTRDNPDSENILTLKWPSPRPFVDEISVAYLAPEGSARAEAMHLLLASAQAVAKYAETLGMEPLELAERMLTGGASVLVVDYGVEVKES